MVSEVAVDLVFSVDAVSALGSAWGELIGGGEELVGGIPLGDRVRL